jgi:hypothetical protein
LTAHRGGAVPIKTLTARLRRGETPAVLPRVTSDYRAKRHGEYLDDWPKWGTGREDTLGTMDGYGPCSECGTVLSPAQRTRHECNHHQLVAHQLRREGAKLDRFEAELAAYLETSRGQFDLWLARHRL